MSRTRWSRGKEAAGPLAAAIARTAVEYLHRCHLRAPQRFPSENAGAQERPQPSRRRLSAPPSCREASRPSPCAYSVFAFEYSSESLW